MDSSVPTADSYRPSIGTRVAEGAAALLLGAVVGVIGTFGHQLVWRELGFAVPTGLIAGLAAVAFLLVGVRIALESRGYAGLSALGVVAAVGVLSLPGANGSVLLPDNIGGVVWAVGPTLVAVVALGWPKLRAPKPSAKDPSRDAESVAS